MRSWKRSPENRRTENRRLETENQRPHPRAKAAEIRDASQNGGIIPLKPFESVLKAFERVLKDIKKETGDGKTKTEKTEQ